MKFCCLICTYWMPGDIQHLANNIFITICGPTAACPAVTFPMFHLEGLSSSYSTWDWILRKPFCRHQKKRCTSTGVRHRDGTQHAEGMGSGRHWSLLVPSLMVSSPLGALGHPQVKSMVMQCLPTPRGGALPSCLPTVCGAHSMWDLLQHQRCFSA